MRVIYHQFDGTFLGNEIVRWYICLETRLIDSIFSWKRDFRAPALLFKKKKNGVHGGLYEEDTMFIIAVCVLSLIKLRWSKSKSLLSKGPSFLRHQSKDFFEGVVMRIILKKFSKIQACTGFEPLTFAILALRFVTNPWKDKDEIMNIQTLYLNAPT